MGQGSALGPLFTVLSLVTIGVCTRGLGIQRGFTPALTNAHSPSLCYWRSQLHHKLPSRALTCRSCATAATGTAPTTQPTAGKPRLRLRLGFTNISTETRPLLCRDLGRPRAQLRRAHPLASLERLWVGLLAKSHRRWRIRRDLGMIARLRLHL